MAANTVAQAYCSSWIFSNIGVWLFYGQRSSDNHYIIKTNANPSHKTGNYNCFVKQDSGLHVVKACVYLYHQCITLVASVNLVNIYNPINERVVHVVTIPWSVM